MADKKISQLTAKGSKIVAIDRVAIAQDDGAGAFSTKYVTGAEINEVLLDTSPQLGGNLDVNANKITSASNGNIKIEPNGTGAVLIGGNDTQPAELRFMELLSNGSSYVGFKAPNDIVTNKVYTLPLVDGTNGQVLSTDGVGVLSFITAGGGNILDQTNGASSIGTTNTISKSISLPSVPNTLKFRASTFRTSGTSLQFTTRVYLSDVSNNIGGTAVQLASIISFNTPANYTRIARNGFDIIGGNIIGMNGTTNNASDDVSQTAARLNTAIPTGTPLYLIFTVQCNSALDSVRVESVEINL